MSENSILLKDFDILEGGDFKLKKNTCLAVSNGQIEKIGRGFDQENFDTVIAGDGRLLGPGFVNAHTHLPMTIFRGYADDLALQDWLQNWIFPAEDKMTREDVYWGTLLGIIELIKVGVTSFSDMYFFTDRVAEAVEESGLRALLAYGIVGESKDEAQEALEANIKLAEAWYQKGRIKVALGPHAPYSCSDEVWELVAKEAEKRDLMLHTHIAETKEDVQDSKKEFGVTPVQRLNKLGVLELPVCAAHVVWPEKEDFEILKDRDVGIVYNPTSNAKLASGVAPVLKYLKKGIKVGIGTDGAASNNDLSMTEEIEWGSYLQKLKEKDPTVLPAEKAFYLATRGGAEVLGEEKVGLIKEGWKADLVAFDRSEPYWLPEHDTLSNLVYASKAPDVSLVMVVGDVLMEDRQVAFIEPKEVYKEVAQRAEKFKS